MREGKLIQRSGVEKQGRLEKVFSKKYSLNLCRKFMLFYLFEFESANKLR